MEWKEWLRERLNKVNGMIAAAMTAVAGVVTFLEDIQAMICNMGIISCGV